MSSTKPTPDDIEFWENKPRSIDRITIKSLDDNGERITITTTGRGSFMRAKEQLGRELHVGDSFDLETVNYSQITGLRDLSGMWLFHYSNEDLLREHQQFVEDARRRRVVDLERNKELYAEWEEALPDWLKARIKRFRDAAGEQFLLEGWGYELAICRLAEAYAIDDADRVDELANQMGTSGNQHGCAKLLADLHKDGRDVDLAHGVPAGLAPLTGSADYS